jgi:serine/threonine protein kinase
MKLPESLRWKAIGRELGRGGQAPVIAVADKTKVLEGTYALKGLAKGRSRKAYERFTREIEATKKLDHPRIIKIFDHSDPEDEFQFYVMEFIEGAKSLKQLLNTPHNPFHNDPVRSVKLYKQIVDAIGHCQARQIVHRDLSPANVLILPNEDIKIIDFGICFVEGGEVITLVDEGVGSRNYTAPECESGGAGNVTTGADLYSAGKILWSAITNMSAFSRETPVFKDKSMSQQIADPRAWHLHHIFAGSIRHNLGDRIGDASQALNIAVRVERLISSGYEPLERISDNRFCPRCGWGQPEKFREDYMTFHNPIPPGFQASRCSYCGYCYIVDTRVIRDGIGKLSSLT